MRNAVLLTGLMVVGVLAGCIGDGGDVDDGGDATGQLTSVYDRHLLPFNVTDKFSRTLDAGVFKILEPLSIEVPVVLPVTEGGAAAIDAPKVHMGLFLPDVPEGTKVPVIADIGPYYGDGDVAATEPAQRLGAFLIENFVPYGYAVAQVSVFGSGQSNHCMDLMGESEQLGIDAAVTYLGGRDWSNGNVGLIGRSYDGSTPWEAATFGNPHLKTIVPISGLVGVHDLMWRNGTAETRAATMHNVVYGQFGIDSSPTEGFIDPGDLQTLCTDYMQGPAQGQAAAATGDWVAPQVNPYWAERHFLTRALANYEGSVYLIHGLQDWNVDNHMAFPTHQLVEEAGLEIKGLYGQWGHMYPDRPMEHIGLGEGKGQEASRLSPRFDWAQDLLEWFDHYLKGAGPKPALHAEVQDNMGNWRIEATYPPLDATWIELTLDQATKGHDTPDVLSPATGALTYAFAPLSEDLDTRIAGNVRFHVTATPTGPGGQILARLLDDETGMHLGHGVMELRYADGGREMQPVVPGQPVVAKMELFALDAILPAGHGLRLELVTSGEGFQESAVRTPVLIDATELSVLKVPTIERGPASFFTPPAWEPCTFPPFIEEANDEENPEDAAEFKERVNEMYGCTL